MANVDIRCRFFVEVQEDPFIANCADATKVKDGIYVIYGNPGLLNYVVETVVQRAAIGNTVDHFLNQPISDRTNILFSMFDSPINNFNLSSL